MHDAFGRTPIRSKASTLAYYQALYQGYGKYYLIERGMLSQMLGTVGLLTLTTPGLHMHTHIA